jgi:ankyrin repeat protein
MEEFQPLLEIFTKDAAADLTALLPKIPATSHFPSDLEVLPEFLSHAPPLISAAAFFGAETCFQTLLDNKADLSAVDLFGTPVSHFAVIGSSLPILTKLVDKRQTFTLSIFPAIEYHQLNSVQWLFDRSLAGRDSIDPRGYSILAVAIENGDIEIVRFLLEKLEDRIHNTASWAPISYAFRLNFLDIAQLLIDNIEIDINEHDLNVLFKFVEFASLFQYPTPFGSSSQ